MNNVKYEDYRKIDKPIMNRNTGTLMHIQMWHRLYCLFCPQPDPVICRLYVYVPCEQNRGFSIIVLRPTDLQLLPQYAFTKDSHRDQIVSFSFIQFYGKLLTVSICSPVSCLVSSESSWRPGQPSRFQLESPKRLDHRQHSPRQQPRLPPSWAQPEL